MKKEKSCGAVVYYLGSDGPLFLIEKMELGHYSLPKGHVENNETEIETAHREIKEETSLELEINPSFRKTITYSPGKDIIKDVVFFISETKSKEVKPQLCEVSSILFLPLDEALKKLTFQLDKDVLIAANEFLHKSIITDTNN